MNGIYHLNRNGLIKIRDAWTRVIMVSVFTFFVGVMAGYAWRLAQVGG